MRTSPTDCLLIAGANTAWAHPVLFRRIEDARAANPALKIIVVDPRRTDTAEAADLHLAILPGTDIALFNAMLHVLLWEDLIDTTYIAAHTEGFAALKAIVRDYTPAMAADICGVKAEDIVTAARWFGGSPAALSLYCQGLNQSSHGTDNNAADSPAPRHRQDRQARLRPFSLTGQPNAMGGREVGGMANLLSAIAIWPMPNTAPKSRACGACLRSPGSRASRRSNCSRPSARGRDQGAVDRLHQPGAVDARPESRACRAGRLPLRRGAGSLRRTPTPRPSPICCCPPPAGARRKAR
jgi:anaerobic selenocysteine-containing dehydrogenase